MPGKISRIFKKGPEYLDLYHIHLYGLGPYWYLKKLEIFLEQERIRGMKEAVKKVKEAGYSLYHPVFSLETWREVARLFREKMDRRNTKNG